MQTRRAVLTTVVLLVVGGLATSVAVATASRSSAAQPDWLVTLNLYRASAGLPPVEEETSWSEQATEHAHYEVANDDVGASQRGGAPYATSGGAEAARNADLAGVARPDLTDRQVLDLWMSTPFHALGILRPDLDRVGYGAWHEADQSSVQSAAVLDVMRGLDPATGDHQRPVMWPGPGSIVPLTRYVGPESPDPLSACPGYSSPAGLPVVVLLPQGGDPGVATVDLDVDDQRVEACVVSEATYVNADPGAQATGRALLGADHAVVIIPREPLPDVGEVAVSLQAGATSLAWTFRTGATTGSILPAHPLA